MSVRAKFKVQSIQRGMGARNTGKDEKGHYTYEPCELQTIVMVPVSSNGDPNHENTRFWQASPSGELRLGTINPEAWSQFELGAEYYVDFTKADA